MLYIWYVVLVEIKPFLHKTLALKTNNKTKKQNKTTNETQHNREQTNKTYLCDTQGTANLLCSCKALWSWCCGQSSHGEAEVKGHVLLLGGCVGGARELSGKSFLGKGAGSKQEDRSEMRAVFCRQSGWCLGFCLPLPLEAPDKVEVPLLTAAYCIASCNYGFNWSVSGCSHVLHSILS